MSHPQTIEEELQIDTHAFEALEKDFQDVLQELAADASLEHFRRQYEKLHRALTSSHENEKKLLKKCKDLNQDIVGNAGKVQVALELTKEEAQNVTILRQEMDKAYRVIEQFRDKEEQNKRKMEGLHEQIRQLRSLVEQGNSMAAGQNVTNSELIAQNQRLTDERDRFSLELASTKNELIQTLEKLKMVEVDNQTHENDIKQLKIKINDLEEKKQKESDRQKKFQDEMENLKKRLDVAMTDCTKKETELSKLQEDLEMLKEEKRELEKERDKKVAKIKNLEGELEDQSANIISMRNYNSDLNRKNHELEEQVTKQAGEINEKVSKVSAQDREINKLKRDKEAIRNQKVEAERAKELAQNSIEQLERIIDDTKKLAEEDRKLIEQMKASRNLLNKEINRAESNNKKQSNDLLISHKANKEKDTEIVKQAQEVEKLKKKISQLEKEKEKYGINAAQANAKYFHALEEIKLKDNLISEFQKKNIETEAKLKQQQNLYEAVRSDRNLYSKNLTETQDEIAEIKRKYKIVNHQISQLKEEIDAKEAALTQEHFELKKKAKELEESQKEIVKLGEEIKRKGEKISNFTSEIGKLQFIIRESERQRKKLQEEYESIISQRDILGTQLIRKNDELALLYEKIKIQQSTLAKGEAQYWDRINDIKLLNQKIRDLEREMRIHRNQSETIPDLKGEIHNLQKELIDEKLKVRGLSEALEDPMNVHRWRKLEGTDSDTYEMITKIQTLQKRLIGKTEECVEKDVVIEQKEKSLNELREMMKRQPSIEDAKMLSTYERSLKQKGTQMKAMAAELNMYQAQVNEYKYENERLVREMNEVKRKYFESKKREQATREHIEREQKASQIQINLPDKRYVGGGFNLAV